MKVMVLALAILVAWPLSLPAQTDCTFDPAGVAAQLAEKARRIAGARRVSASEFQWVDASGRTITLDYGGCVDLGVKVSVSQAHSEGFALGQADLLHAVARYWSAVDARAMAAVLAGEPRTVHVRGDARIEVFGPGAGGAFPLGLTISLADDDVSVWWQEL